MRAFITTRKSFWQSASLSDWATVSLVEMLTPKLDWKKKLKFVNEVQIFGSLFLLICTCYRPVQCTAQCSKGVKLKKLDFRILLAEWRLLVISDSHELKFLIIIIEKVQFLYSWKFLLYPTLAILAPTYVIKLLGPQSRQWGIMSLKYISVVRILDI